MSLFERYDITPLHDYVIVRRKDADELNKAGIILPFQEQSVHAVVLAVGPGRPLQSGEVVPCQVKKGDNVIVDRIGGVEIEIEGEKIVVMREAEIIACIERKPDVVL